MIEALVRKHKQSFENVLFDIKLGDTKFTVTARQTTFHPSKCGFSFDVSRDVDLLSILDVQ
jgi:hypothetical protein